MNADQFDEIQLLLKFGESPNQPGNQHGIKVHSNASDTHRAAISRLFAKGMVTNPDGGYLTDRGIEAAEHCQHLAALLER
ncbi:MAG: TIGR02647 family protein [Pseudomonadales bacterium]|nr:TIGR02647 family protein [Gammaproteobacteria bacterium]NNL57208.1 TIGR02647 family protein [Pseudomonadales bacterium]